MTRGPGDNRDAEEARMPAVHLIMVPVDFSPTADAAAHFAAWLAGRLGARLRLVYALADGAREDAEYSLADMAARVTALAPGTAVETEVLVVDQPVPDVIVSAARRAGADLVAMATHGGSQARRMLLGSVADEVVRTADCPVLTLK